MHTMWFVAILIQFYFIFPLIIYGKRWQKVTIMFIVFIVYNILGTFFPIDERIIWLFPCFAFGCLLGEMHFLDVRNKLHLKAPIQKVICFLSTASFCAYLFHRHIMVVIEKTVMPEDGIIRLFFLYVVCVPIILISGYYVQVSYNSVVQKNYINGKTRS